MKVWVDIQSQEENRRVLFEGMRLTIGRGETADLRIAAAALSRLHASIHRDGDQLWVLDEGSANGTFVNSRNVALNGTPLSDGDVIQLGESVRLTIRFDYQGADQILSESPSPGGLPRPSPVIAAVLAGCFLLGILALGVHLIRTRGAESRTVRSQLENSGDGPPKQILDPTPQPTETSINNPNLLPSPVIKTGQEEELSDLRPAVVLYRSLGEEQRYDFLDRRARQIALMMGNRGTVFDKEVIGYIKYYVDAYAGRVGNGSTRLWGEDLNNLFARATTFAPFIIAAFRKESVPIVIGLYIPVIESEYHKELRSPVGALGMFQFMDSTAIHYQVSPADRIDPQKMAPAAALYMKDRILEFGTDAKSVALSIAGYNRSPQSVRRDLQDVVDSKSNERSFWTLLANKEELDHYFQTENVKYVPKFFAAAIVGETPEAFGLRIRKLSTYDQP